MPDSIQNIKFNLTGKGIIDSISGLFETGLLEMVPPSLIQIDFKKQKVKSDWLTAQIAVAKKEAILEWDDQSLRFYPGDPDRIWVSIDRPVGEGRLVSALENIPFALASFRTLYPVEWNNIDPDYTAPGFGNGHYPHGWACAIKGDEGHEQFVSRRWIERGPWKTIRGRNDLSFIFFHALDVDAAAALRQARPGHLHMGNSDEGGFMQPRYIFEHEIKGSYDPGSGTLKVTVFGQRLQPKQLLDYSAARRLQVLGKDEPLKRIAFIFIEKKEAVQYLETLWLRDMECYAIIDGAETRLDEGYQPSKRSENV